MGDAQSMQQGEATYQSPATPRKEVTHSSAECEMVTVLTGILSSRPQQSVLLSDLGALLPEHLRLLCKERGGLRGYVRRFPIFRVSGKCGKEHVTLALGAPSPDDANNEVCPAPSGFTLLADQDTEDDIANQTMVLLRGLPFRATAADVQQFLGKYAKDLFNNDSIEMILSPEGRPSGFAQIRFASHAIAKAAALDLHNRTIHVSDNEEKPNRYIEAFLYSDRPSAFRTKKGAPPNQILGPEPVPMDPELESEAARVTPEEVVNEIRRYMQDRKKEQMPLSMLGMVLSPAMRLHLKRSDSGVKHLLQQYPELFAIGGAKGRENVIYTPSPTETEHKPANAKTEHKLVNDCPQPPKILELNDVLQRQPIDSGPATSDSSGVCLPKSATGPPAGNTKVIIDVAGDIVASDASPSADQSSIIDRHVASTKLRPIASKVTRICREKLLAGGQTCL